MTVRRGAGAAPALLVLALAALAHTPVPLAAQSLDLSGYALGVAAHAGSGDLGPGGTSLLARARIMPVVTWNAFTLDVAYEHVLQRNPEGGGFAITTPGGTATTGSDWLGVDWDIRSTTRTSWRHRFDRLSLGFDAGPLSVTVGRQAISWATTLILTPGDPFSPFDPSDPFREYRGGVDAVRVRAFPGPFSEVEAVVRAADFPGGSTVTALARAQTSRGGWAFGGWAGVVHDQGAATVFATGAAGATALRGSMSVRRDAGGKATLRSAVGADRRFSVADRDLFGVVELQYDGFGAASADRLLAVALSAPYARGELQTLGRWSGATQWRYDLHPLVTVDALALVDLHDGSALLAPGVSWSVTSAASVRAGLFVGAGPGGMAPGAGLRSEYGSVPAVWYGALSLFF